MQLKKQEPVQTGLKPLKTGETDLFISAVKSARIVNCDMERLKEVLRLVMLKVGIRAANLPQDEEKAVLLYHIVSNYGNHTPDEIRLAFDMAISGKLDIDPKDVTCYENFSCLYFSKIMNAYRNWAAQEAKYLSNKKKELPKLDVPEMTNLEIIECGRRIYEFYSKQHKEGDYGRVKFVSVSCYNALLAEKKLDWLTLSKNHIFKNRANIVLKELLQKDPNYCGQREFEDYAVRISKQLVCGEYFENETKNTNAR